MAKPTSDGESNTNKKTKAASDKIEPEELRAMTKEFLAMTKLYSSSSEDENFTFSPVLLALNLHIIAKMIGAHSVAENGRRELEWFVGSACDVVVPKLLRGCLSDVGNGIWFDLKFWFVDFNRLHQGMEGLRRCFAKAVAVAPRQYTRGHVNEAAAVEDMNHWIKVGTSNLTDKVLPDHPLAGKTALLAANLLNFKETWVEMFDESDTNENDFYLRDRRQR